MTTTTTIGACYEIYDHSRCAVSRDISTRVAGNDTRLSTHFVIVSMCVAAKPMI